MVGGRVEQCTNSEKNLLTVGREGEDGVKGEEDLGVK